MFPPPALFFFLPCIHGSSKSGIFLIFFFFSPVFLNSSQVWLKTNSGILWLLYGQLGSPQKYDNCNEDIKSQWICKSVHHCTAEASYCSAISSHSQPGPRLIRQAVFLPRVLSMLSHPFGRRRWDPFQGSTARPGRWWGARGNWKQRASPPEVMLALARRMGIAALTWKHEKWQMVSSNRMSR